MRNILYVQLLSLKSKNEKRRKSYFLSASTKLMMKLRPKYINLLFLSFGALILISGCKIQSKELKAMRGSPIANMQLTTAKEVKRSYRDKNITFGKPIYAYVKIEYEPKINYTKEDVYREIVNNLENNGWRRDLYNVGQRGYYSASQPYESFSLVVKVFNHQNLSTVRIDMEHRARKRQLNKTN